jgi:hypothetical protein
MMEEAMTIDELMTKLDKARAATAGDCEVRFARGGDTVLDAAENHSVDEVVLITGMGTPGYPTGHPALVYLVQT